MHLNGPVEGMVADTAIGIDRILRTKLLRPLDRLIRPCYDSSKSIETKEIAVGCLDAADDTYFLLTQKMHKYWNIARIRVKVHSAVVVYEDTVGGKNTYVLDAWSTQIPEVYTWNEWPFCRLNRFVKVQSSQQKLPKGHPYWKKMQSIEGLK